MFVKTQFDTIVNLADFDKIKIEWSVKQDSGNVFHVISVVSDEYSYKPMVGGSIDTASEVPVVTRKSETLAQFQQDMAEQAKNAYIGLFEALLQGKTAFDMTVDWR